MPNPKKVMTFGSFDVIHEGHRSLFRQALEFGGINSKLLVVVASDERYKKFKKKEPLYTQKERVLHVQKERNVHLAIAGDKLNTLVPILTHKPEIIVFGYDQPLPIPTLKKMLKKEGFIPQRIVRAKSHLPRIYKSSLIKKKLGKNQ